jgi:MoaA/NifB/PqqE/SkfB family radical SAM enzyme
LYGFSYTVTKENFNEVINNEVIKTDIENGCFWFNFFEYVPIDPQTRHLMITKEQKELFRQFVFSFRKKYKTHIFSPVLETNYVCGCTGARHIAHITSDGNLEPCPFIQHSDTSVLGITLKEALKSRFFSQIRTHLSDLEEIDSHSCKLFTHKEWILKTLEEGNSIKLRMKTAETVGHEQR